MNKSKQMAQIKSKDTKPELLVRKYLHAQGFRFRLNVKKLPGSPDIVLKKYKTAIFVNGCFWHAHENCKIFKLPKTNPAFWAKKLGKNQLRDLRCSLELEEQGWNVITVWGCELKPKERELTLKFLAIKIKNRDYYAIPKDPQRFSSLELREPED